MIRLPVSLFACLPLLQLIHRSTQHIESTLPEFKAADLNKKHLSFMLHLQQEYTMIIQNSVQVIAEIQKRIKRFKNESD